MWERLIVFAIGLLMLLSEAAGAQDNLLYNPGFEEGPPGPQPAPGWVPWGSGAPAEYEVLDLSSPWAVLSGAQSQSWRSSVPFQGGLFQAVSGAVPGEDYTAGVFFGDPDPAGPLGPTQFRIGIGVRGSVPPTGTIWSPWHMVTGPWEEATVTATAQAAEITVALMSVSYGGGGAPPTQLPYPSSRIIVDDARFGLVRTCASIAGVPDTNPPLQNSLGVPNVTFHCAPISGANITQYWDVVKNDARAAGVDAGLAATVVAPYIGYWMDTNNSGCPYRSNGSIYAGAPGTYVADIAPGLAAWVRWDANNGFGCTFPVDRVGPVLPAGKVGYPWTVATNINPAGPALVPQACWNQLVNEINAGRPLIVSWSYWNPVSFNPPVIVKGVEYCDWGPVQQNPPEGWNDLERTQGLGAGAIGHDVTAFGYCTNYRPAAHAPASNWVMVHDNWANTGVDIALPWMTTAAPQWSPWVANTTVNLQAPQVGTLALTTPWIVGVRNHYWAPGGLARNVMGRFRLTAGAAESAVVNAVTLKASGTGNDKTDILSVDLIADTNSNGKADAGEAPFASGSYQQDDGTLTIWVQGPVLQIAAGAAKDVLITYSMNNNPLPAAGKNYSFSLNAMYATGGTTFLPLAVHGLPYNSATKTVGKIWVQPHPCPRIGLWKMQPDGTWGHILCSPVVSLGTGRYGKVIYIEEEDRSSGIRVDFGDETPPVLPEGARLNIEAFIHTESGERVLVQPQIPGFSQGPPLLPVSMNNRQVGGSPWFYDPGTGAGQRGAGLEYGLSTVGLLVRTFGRYQMLDPVSFLVDDGSGEAIRCEVPPGVSLDPGWHFLAVTGVCSTETDGEALIPVLLVRTLEDLEILY